ncbi:AAA family ATPase [Pyruvatibacter sp.]
MVDPSFQLKAAQFVMDDGLPQKIQFLGPSAVSKKTHITLIAGANGTSKSRILASIVDHICEIEDEHSEQKISKRYSSSGNHGLSCTWLAARSSNSEGEKSPESQQLPSRVLVLSNLVMDRFRFAQNDPDEESFYQYLGVRQATNLMTTGSMQRSVSEAVMSLSQSEGKRKLFQKWLELVFGKTKGIALTFDRFSRSEIESYLAEPDPGKTLEARMVRSMGTRFNDERIHKEAKAAAPKLLELFKYLLDQGEGAKAIGKKDSRRNSLVLRLDTLPEKVLAELANLQAALLSATRGRFLSWPSLTVEGKGQSEGQSGWIEFGQLSSGEQNIISTGAKLIAHARPGCLIAIDEPEVSLNTAWQQHYTDLVRQSLAQAKGSHVLIATHSPHLIASLPAGESSVVLIQKTGDSLATSTVDADFEGWGSETVLYQVLDVPSASSFKFQRELASVLLHIQESGRDRNLLDSFLDKAGRLNFEGADTLTDLIGSIKEYRDALE